MNNALQNKDKGPGDNLVTMLEGLSNAATRLDDTSVEQLDTQFRAAIGKVTRGMSPVQLSLAYADWLMHLSIAPARRLQLLQSLVEKMIRLTGYAAGALRPRNNQPPLYDSTGFRHELWQKPPFNLLSQAHLARMSWLSETTSDVPGMDPLNAELVSFINEQIFESLSPANFPLTNPEVLQTTVNERGRNLVRGLNNLVKDVRNKVTGKDAPDMGDFKVGENLATTPGKVVFRNELIELIQYSPATETVAKEPVLFVPAWIMKYYILDLSPNNSMIKYLVEQGKTVFAISWKNPGSDDRDLCLDDYLKSGFLEAVAAVRAIVPRSKINAVGYCIGGTLLAMGAAYLAREKNNCLNSVTLFAAQVDFTEPGEIRRFLGSSQVAFVNSLMWTDGYLDGANMGGAFKALRAQDLIWNPNTMRYFLGRESKPNDLMAWNADTTRMPVSMHSRYLRELFMENRLATCKYEVDGRPLSLQDIRVPLFVVGTSADHVAPWKSVYKVQYVTDTEVTFLLTSGGHNAGIICGPEHPRRRYQVATHTREDLYISPEEWAGTVATSAGSWWPAWHQWLDQHSTSRVKPPALGAAKKGYKAVADAPGDYVFG